MGVFNNESSHYSKVIDDLSTSYLLLYLSYHVLFAEYQLCTLVV